MSARWWLKVIAASVARRHQRRRRYVAEAFVVVWVWASMTDKPDLHADARPSSAEQTSVQPTWASHATGCDVDSPRQATADYHAVPTAAVDKDDATDSAEHRLVVQFSTRSWPIDSAAARSARASLRRIARPIA